MVIGNHILINGDCLEEMPTIESGSVDMILCDLPYGTTACKWDVIIPFDKLWKEYERVIKPNGAIVLFADEPFTSKLILSNLRHFRYKTTWDKKQGSGFLNSHKRPLTQTEDIVLFSLNKLGLHTYNPQLRDKEKNKIRPIGNRKPVGITTYGANNCTLSDSYDNTKSHPTNLISISSKTAECNSTNRVHPTQKPVALFEYLIKTYTNEGETVLDNCAGSFTTAVACENTGRKSICIEKDEKYFNIGVERVRNIQPTLFKKAV